MLTTILKNAIRFGRNKMVAAAAIAGAAACMGASPAMAHSHGWSVDVVVPAPVVVVDERCEQRVESRRVWVEPVYRTCTERVWVDAVTTTQMQRVEIPAEYAWRDVIEYDRFGRAHRTRQQVMVCPARCEERPVQVVVCPGHYEQRSHQELVCDGHWEIRSERFEDHRDYRRDGHDEDRHVEYRRPGVRLEIPLPF